MIPVNKHRALLTVAAVILAQPMFAHFPEGLVQAQVNSGVRTTGIQLVIGGGAGGYGKVDQGGFFADTVGLELLQSNHSSNHEFRFQALGPGYRWVGPSGWAIQTSATPFISFGGITGPGAGAQAQCGVSLREYTFGAQIWVARGRANPWQHDRTTSEMRLFVRVRLAP